jgi:uncharacterized membrane protein
LSTESKNSFDDPGKRRIGPFAVPFLAWLFLLYALPMIVFLAVTIPPFQVTDEYAHALRADQVSRGKLISPRLGGDIDGALYAFGRLYYTGMPFHSEVKHAPETARAAATVRWAVPDHDENFQNTAQYGPVLYLPQAMAIWLGKLVGLNPVWTILGTRLVNGLVAALISFIAIRICRRGQALLFTTLLLPMTMSEFGSVSQDALIISLSLLVVALASRIIDEGRSAKVWEFALFVFIVVATTLGRPSQLALLPLGLALIRGREILAWRNLVIATLGLISAAAWMVVLFRLMPDEVSGGSVSGQFAAMIRHPLLLPTVLAYTFQESGWWLLGTMVGRLGWVDTPMPEWYVWTAVGTLVCGWLAPGNRPPWTRPALISLVTLVAVLMATSAALYMSWTPVGKMTIDGVQGRYMLPVLPLLAWMAPVYARYLARAVSPVWIMVGAFPLVTLATLPGVIMDRYYGSWSETGLVLKVLFFG